LVGHGSLNPFSGAVNFFIPAPLSSIKDPRKPRRIKRSYGHAAYANIRFAMENEAL